MSLCASSRHPTRPHPHPTLPLITHLVHVLLHLLAVVHRRQRDLRAGRAEWGEVQGSVKQRSGTRGGA